ncbi:MAG: NUDIX hydrolase [Hyphomicrobiales bacterium]|nr:NUDIX hydrolase [Hyphomicrobiales bacterium]
MRVSYKYSHSRPMGHGNIESGKAPVKPRDAATLIIWRNHSRGVEVLMGRRSRRAAFVPDFYVFPGGRLDPLDYQVRPATPLSPLLTDGMGVRGSKRLAEALAVTAVRETFEETGLLLAESGDVGIVSHPDWLYWKARGLAPGLHHLGYFGRAITSPLSPIRFNARFFIVHSDLLQGQLGGSGELSELDFYPAEDILDNKLILDVTEFMLKSLMRFAANPADFDRPAPLFSYRGLTPFIHYHSPRNRSPRDVALGNGRL